MMENVDEEASDLLTKINDEEMSTTEDIVTDSSPAKFEAEQSNIVSSTAGIAGLKHCNFETLWDPLGYEMISTNLKGYDVIPCSWKKQKLINCHRYT